MRFFLLRITFVFLGFAVVDPAVAAPTWDSVKSEIARDFPGIPQVTTTGLAALLADVKRPQPLLLDVRTRAEYDVSHLPKAIWAGNPKLQRETLRQVPLGQLVVVYCSVGLRSAQVVERLKQEGRKNVFNLDGSIFQWANEGRLLISGSKPVQVVHPYDQKWGRLLDKRYWPRHIVW